MKPCNLIRLCLFLALALSAIAQGKVKSTERGIPKILSNQRKTKHFHFYTNLDVNSLDYYEQVFEGFYSYFNKNYFRIRQKRPLKVFLFKDTESYEPFARKARKSYTRYGFYMGRKKNIIVVNRQSGLGTATHELVHHFTAVSFASKPDKWVREGIATFFEKFIGHLDSEGKMTISFGYFSNWRFPKTKKRLDKISLKNLIASRKPDQCVARSLMLFLHKKGVFKPFVKQMRVKRNDPTGAVTLQKVYGKPLAEIEREWKVWIKAQPVDDNVKLVRLAFVKTDQQWKAWWKENKSRLYWSEKEHIYKVKQ